MYIFKTYERLELYVQTRNGLKTTFVFLFLRKNFDLRNLPVVFAKTASKSPSRSHNLYKYSKKPARQREREERQKKRKPGGQIQCWVL